MAAKFDSATSIGGRDIVVCAKIQGRADIAIRKFRKIGLKCLFRPPKIMFLGSFDPQTLFFIIETPKRPYLTQKHAF